MMQLLMMKMKVMSNFDWLVFVQLRCLVKNKQLRVVEDFTKSKLRPVKCAKDRKC